MTTIRQQLTRHLLLAVGLLIAAGGLAVYLCARGALRAQFDATLRARAQSIIALTEVKKNRVVVDFPDGQTTGFETGGLGFFELWQTDGSSVERSPSLRDSHLPLRHGTLEAPEFWDVLLPGGQAGRAIGVKFRPPESDDARAEAILVVAAPRRELDRTLATLGLILGASGLLLLGGTAWVVPRVLRRGLQPLQRLADEAARIDAATLSARFPTADLPGELAPITARLNELLARLEESFERGRRFSSDVAHEFRTPIAELRSLAELAIKLPDARSAAADQEVLSIALHLESILTRLLALARGERGELAAHRERVDVRHLVEGVCRRFQDKAAGRRLVLNCRLPVNAIAETDAVLLRSILTNLLDNAVEYSPRDHAIDVEVNTAHGQLTLRVVNDVEHLDERDLPRLFERFWRKDAARASNGHTGLGLPLARAFARALGCELTASFAAPARLALTLAPAARQSREDQPVSAG